MSDEEEGGRLSSGGNTYERIVQIVTALIAIAFISVIYISTNFTNPPLDIGTKWFKFPVENVPPIWHAMGYIAVICVLPFFSRLLRFALEGFDRWCDDRFF